MANETSRNIRLGVFVTLGTALLVTSLYMIGSNQNLFGSTFRISVKFYNVNGLIKGNNVRFAGINVGTVEKVEILNDSVVNVVMVIEKDIQPFIKKNSIANVGTDGLMGNKLVNINSVKEPAPGVEEGDNIHSNRPIEQDEMLRTLNETNENMKSITSNLKSITERISSKNSLWSLLMDTIVADNVKTTIVNIKAASNSTALLTGNLKNIVGNIENGKGTLGALITDTVLSGKINQTVINFKKFSDTSAIITGNLSKIISQIERGKGTVGILLKDTMFIHNLNRTVESINKSSVTATEDLEALKHSFILRRYFKKQQKENKNK